MLIKEHPGSLRFEKIDIFGFFKAAFSQVDNSSLSSKNTHVKFVILQSKNIFFSKCLNFYIICNLNEPKNANFFAPNVLQRI